MHVTGKKISYLSLILLLIVGTTLLNIPSVHAQLPYFSVNPPEITVPEPGLTFTVNVTINNVTDFGCWEFKLGYNTTLLDALLVSPTEWTENNTDWIPVDAAGIYHPDAPPTIQDDTGLVWVGALVPVFLGEGLNGSFPLVTITFNGTTIGNCTLHLYDTKPGDSYGDRIAQDPSVDGLVIVVPEFPQSLLTLLLIITLAATFLGKMVWSRKRKDIPTLNK